MLSVDLGGAYLYRAWLMLWNRRLQRRCWRACSVRWWFQILGYERVLARTVTPGHDLVTVTRMDTRGRVIQSRQPMVEYRGLVTAKSVAGLVGATGAFTAAYDADGGLDVEVYPNGITATTISDPAGNDLTLTYTAGSTLVAESSREWGSNGNVTTDCRRRSNLGPIRRGSLARRNSRFSCSNSLIRLASVVVRPGSTPSSMSACLTHVRNDSTPQPIWSATRWTVPCEVPSSLRSCRTSRTALAFSSGEYRRFVGFPAVLLVPMAPSSFPRSGASTQPRVDQIDLKKLGCGAA